MAQTLFTYQASGTAGQATDSEQLGGISRSFPAQWLVALETARKVDSRSCLLRPDSSGRFLSHPSKVEMSQSRPSRQSACATAQYQAVTTLHNGFFAQHDNRGVLCCQEQAL